MVISKYVWFEKKIDNAFCSLRDFNYADLEAILLIDAKIGFNSLNLDLALRNIEKLCPSNYYSICNIS